MFLPSLVPADLKLYFTIVYYIEYVDSRYRPGLLASFKRLVQATNSTKCLFQACVQNYE